MIKESFELREFAIREYSCDGCHKELQGVPFTISGGYGSVTMDTEPEENSDKHACSPGCLESVAAEIAIAERSVLSARRSAKEH